MRKATENQGDTRALGDCFSPRSKVKDLAVEQRSPSHTSFHQETPMKPSQVPNRLSNPPPRRMLPIQTPELCYRDRMGPHWQNPHPPGPIHSSGFNSSSSPNIGSPVNRPYFMTKDRLGPPKHFAQPPGLIPSNPTNIGISSNAAQPVPRDQHPGSFGTFLLPVAINQFSSSHIGRDQVIESKATSSISGSKTVITQRQESNKAQSSDVGYSIPTVQLHRPSVSVTTPPFNSRAPSEVHPQSSSHSERWYPDISHWPLQGYQLPPKPHLSNSSHLPIMHSYVASCQNQQQEQTPSSEKLIPAVDLNCSSHKRRSENEYCSETAKKPCPQGANSDKTETTKPTICTTLVPQPSVTYSSVSENQHKTSDGYLCAEQACRQSACSELSPTVKPSQSCCKLPSHKECTQKIASMGAKRAFINSSPNHIVQLKEKRSPLKPNEESVKKTNEEQSKRDKSSTLLPSEVPQKDTTSSAHAELGSHLSGFSASSSSILPVKTPSRSNHVGENRKLSSSTHKSTSKSKSLSGRTGERNKASRSRKPVASYDTNDLFTPDPVTYVFSPSNKTAKPKIDGESNKTPEKGSSSTATSSSTPVTESSCEKPQNSKVTGPLLEASSSVPNPLGSFPTVTLMRVKLENLMTPSPRDKDLKNSPIPSSHRQLKDDQNPSVLCNKVSSSAVETDSADAEQNSTSSCCQSLPQTSKGDKKQVNEDDPIDVELDLGLSFAVDLDLTQSSHSSEDEQLLSLEEMMERATKPPDTPEKGAFSDPSTPRRLSSQSKTQPFVSTTKSGTYKNNLDQILKEINNNKKTKEIERQLLTACEEDLLKIAEYEEAEENREEGISTEQQEFLQRYSLMSAAIKEVPPGEEVFNLEKFGQIFDQETLQLRQCMVNPQGTAQKTLLWSSPAQLRLHVNIGLFQEAYDSSSPCPAQVTRFLFKMMSVHSERMISEKLLQALCDIALTAAYQIVKYGSQQFKVWVPSLSDVTLVLMNMGVPFVKLFPFENLQPPFTEGDLLEDVYMKNDSPSGNKEETTFPEHNCSNILKYLSYCMGLCPRAYSDNELVLLLTVMSHVGLETRLILESSVALEPLLCKIVNNIRDWETLLPEICLALTDLTDDHHNMCLLVHLLPDSIHGKELRRHLSLCMISKLLDGNCNYRPVEREFQLSSLRPYLPRMQPSSLLREMMSPSGRNQKDKDEDLGMLDQQSYYLCYSLLTLANEASNFQFFPAHQKKQLLILSTELETHVKCDIRESEKCLYRSKVKDLVARIYTKWQMLLQRTRPLDDKLYDYWQPVDTLGSTHEEQEDEDDTAEERTVVEEEEEEAEEGDRETTITEENEAVIFADEEKEDSRVEPEEDMKLGETEEDTKPGQAEDDTKFGEAEEDVNIAEAEEVMKVEEELGEMEEDTIPNDTSKTEEEKEAVPGDLNQVPPETAPQALKESEAVNEQMDAHNVEHVEEDFETVEREASHLAPTADLV